MNDQLFRFRPASVDDFEGCLAIDHSYQTRQVWQLHVTELDNVKQVRFQTVKLPKETAVSYPYADEALVQRWCASEWFMVGECKGSLQAYITAAVEKLTPTAWIYDMVVAPEYRHQGHGSDLVALAANWARQQKAQQLMVALPMKNDPAMRFFRKSGFTFCGYNETSYRTKDISLFFSVKL
ncbi:MAG: GNAT family N-acetyltransferase [Anaerolineae bacterium]|nr:GNAT family N-acetyltransferase [Anaerolineae bacterium]